MGYRIVYKVAPINDSEDLHVILIIKGLRGFLNSSLIWKKTIIENCSYVVVFKVVYSSQYYEFKLHIEQHFGWSTN